MATYLNEWLGSHANWSLPTQTQPKKRKSRRRNSYVMGPDLVSPYKVDHWPRTTHYCRYCRSYDQHDRSSRRAKWVPFTSATWLCRCPTNFYIFQQRRSSSSRTRLDDKNRINIHRMGSGECSQIRMYVECVKFSNQWHGDKNLEQKKQKIN